MMRSSATPGTGRSPDSRPQHNAGKLSRQVVRRSNNGRKCRSRAEPFTLTVTRVEAGFLGWVISAARRVGESLECPLGDGYYARAESGTEEFALTFCSGEDELGSVSLDPRRVRRGRSLRVGEDVEYRGPWAMQLQALLDFLSAQNLQPVATLIEGGNFALPRVA